MSTTTMKTRTTAKAETAKPTPTPKESPAKPAKPEPTCLRDALITTQAALIKQRGNGTTRSLPYLSPGTEARIEAETVAALVAAGKKLTDVADEKKVSLATARRFLTNLGLAKRVEAGEFDALLKPGAKQITVHRVEMKATSK